MATEPMVSPLPSTRVIHPRWASHHAPVAEGTMNATCTITNGAEGGGWEPDTGPSEGTPTQTYTGRCLVQYEQTLPRRADAADQPTSTRTVLVALPAGSTGQEAGARVKITAVDSNGPLELVGRTFTVQAVSPSSLGFQQNLTCWDDQSNQEV